MKIVYSDSEPSAPANVTDAVAELTEQAEKGGDGDYPSESTESKAAVYAASIYPTQKTGLLPNEFVSAAQRLEQCLGRPVWFLLQDLSPPKGDSVDTLDTLVEQLFFMYRNELPDGQPIALVINSSGGDARSAYKIATLIRRKCGSFVAVIPEYAKSAATLLALGASEIILGYDAELGPLDAQLVDDEREQITSALDEVQALDRLHSFAIQAIDREMALYTRRSGKKISSLLPDVQRFVASFMEPLLQKIDTVNYTHMSRVLKVAEEYAVRLLRPQYNENTARVIANKLVHAYPAHGFVIDRAEAERIGLKVKPPDKEIAACLDGLMLMRDNADPTVIGHLEEIEDGSSGF